jgi:hypothetical protein
MRTFLTAAVVALAAGSALGQTRPTDSSASPTLPTESSAIATPATTETSPSSTFQAPVRGADIPEEDQAKSRIEAKGYSNVSGLQKDDRGIWRGDATMKDGRSVVVILDLQGNIYSKLPTAEDQ